MINEKYIKVLYIHLETGKIRIEQREDLLPYLGGAGVASKLLQENVRPELKYDAPEQPIVIAIGAGSFVFPVLTKVVAMFVSPLTGELGESHAAGRLAMAMLLAGYDAMVLTGKAEKPIYISITTNDVNIRDARALWGLSINEIGRTIRDREHGGGRSSGKRSILSIGPAGENGVSYACVSVDIYRHFGRMGLGACMGAKNLKAISIVGNRSIPIKNPAQYFKIYQKIYKKSTETDGMKKYHDIGTPVNIMPLNKIGSLPTRNLQSGSFEGAQEISGEAFAENNLVRKMACTGCPVGCIHVGMYRREFDSGYEYEAINVPYDYELIFALGTFLGIGKKEAILSLIEEVEELGIDAISAGVCLAWATEALQQGIITVDNTLTNLAFGNTEAYVDAIRYLASGVNEFYRDLGKGSRFAAAKYGGYDFAMQLAGNEMPGYHTGYGSLVGITVGARHSHLCNGGYGLDQTTKEFDEDTFIENLFAEECERCMTNSLVMCLFARKVYDREIILEALNSIGWNLTNDDLTAIGKRVYQTKLEVKKALGFSQTSVKIPKRFFETPTMNGMLDEETAYRLIRKFAEKNEALMREKL